jgi:hypothetical protein
MIVSGYSAELGTQGPPAEVSVAEAGRHDPLRYQTIGPI